MGEECENRVALHGHVVHARMALAVFLYFCPVLSDPKQNQIQVTLYEEHRL